MKLKNRDIYILAGIFFALVLLILALIYFSQKEDPAITESGNQIDIVDINKSDESDNEIGEPRTDEEETIFLNDVIDKAITGEPYETKNIASDIFTKRPDLTEESYNKLHEQITTLAIGRNWKAIESIANQVTNEYFITNSDWNNFFYACLNINGLYEDGDVWSRQTSLAAFFDPEMYVYIFISLPSEEQAAFLPRLNMSILPNNEDESPSILLIEDEDIGLHESSAFRYFSDSQNTKVTKFVVQYNNGEMYDIYFASNMTMGIWMITDITSHNSSSQNNTTYEEYFDVYGIIPEQIIYD